MNTFRLPFRAVPQFAARGKRRAIGQGTPLSTDPSWKAGDLASALGDTLNPAKTYSTADMTSPSRPPSQPSDARNPALQNYPSASGSLANSTATPRPMYNSSRDTSRSGGNSSSPFVSPPGTGMNGGEKTSDIMRSTLRRSPRRANSQGGAKEAQERIQAYNRQVEAQASRTWSVGDVYAPHDISPIEQQKHKIGRMGGKRTQRQFNTRRNGRRDQLDQAGVNPLREYKNFSMLSQFVTETGRIKSGRETGLRAVNQRKMAKAIRRAIGTGILLPSVYKHPELMAERGVQRSSMVMQK